MKLSWKFGIIAGLFLAIFSLYPQFKMLYLRGSEWNGHYAYNDVDEVAYASYLKALIDGRPRKNDPYTGRDESPETPQPESLFSIQFAAPYSIAIPARLFGVSAPWAMTISGAVAAFLTALLIFWLVGMITGDSLFAMAASLTVLAGGALFAGEGAIGEILGTSYSYPYFPGFRRYLPAMAFPAFFLMVGLVWKLVGTAGEDIQKATAALVPRRRALTLTLASIAFGYTVFSYFYIWTTAAAWLGCLGICWLALRPDGFWRDIKTLAALGVACLAFLAPYAYLLQKRAHSMDGVQLLVRTHAPDLTRPPELISFVVLAVIAAGVLLKLLELRHRATLFALSLALTPIVIFNQQVITGQSLQPIHYQVFIGNYVVGLAVVVTLALFWPRLAKSDMTAARAAAAALAICAAGWGFAECHFTVRVLDDVNIARDEAYPVAMRLAELGRDDPDRNQRVVLHLGTAEADDLPTIAPQAVLWSRHQHVFAGLSWDEHKERFYQMLYYQGISEWMLAERMKKGEDIVSVIALFGWGRHTDRLNAEYRPLTFGEIDAEARRYGAYAKAFDASAVGVPRLDYLVVPETLPDAFLINVDKWYQRDAGERFGKYVLYRLKLN